MAAKPKKRRAAAQTTKPRRRKARNPSRVTRSRKNFFTKAAPVRRRRRAPARKNPLVIIRSKRRNPSGNVILEFIVAGTGIGMVQPWVAGFASRLGIPGQFITPASTAATGIGLSWVFGWFKMTKRLSEPAFILGVATAVVSLIAPIVRRWITPSMAAQPTSGVNGRYANGPRGIGVWSGQPTNPPVRIAASSATSTKTPVAATNGPKGIGIWATPAGRFTRR